MVLSVREQALLDAFVGLGAGILLTWILVAPRLVVLSLLLGYGITLVVNLLMAFASLLPLGDRPSLILLSCLRQLALALCTAFFLFFVT